MSLAWTNPNLYANSVLNDKILYVKVVNSAIDLFTDSSEVASALGTGAASAFNSENVDSELPQASLPEVVSKLAKRPWKIPRAV